MIVYWSALWFETIVSGRGAQNESGGCRLSSEIRHGKICSWCPNVHRGYAQNKAGPVTKSGQSQLGSGDSNAYQFGSSAQSAKRPMQVATTTCGSPKQAGMRDKAKEDARRTSAGGESSVETGVQEHKRDGLTVVTIHEYKH